ncbi:PepSY domain-containing protein [Micromonospora sp. WMMD1082]|uniref:PepSY domain-containing protein n=1 Tax=Micromonospora sp. WMMD1082 TaxID=3016104 RepID=UPI0024174535|nr:PepSY domain-containing protein [Micromonospora sp. WMMD1082]MDG4792911.1 PepSY domain-containing protein [Micromonospora sp. WMMD1082]
MKRNPLILASAGGAAAVLAVTGVLLGVAAADNSRAEQATLTAATSAPTTAGVPDDATPDDSGTLGTPAEPTGAATPADPGNAGTPATAADAVSLERAGEIAVAHVGGGRITEIERDREKGRPVWEVEIVRGNTEHEIYVDRETGTVVKAEQEPVDDDDDDDDDDRYDD